MDREPREGGGEMSTQTVRKRIEMIERELDRLEPHYVLGVMNGTLREADRAEKLFASIQKDVAALAALVTPKTKARDLSPAEAITTHVDADEQMTLGRGNHIYQVDALHECAMGFMPDDVRAYWRTAGPHKFAGYVAHEPEVAEQLETRGILVWQSEVDGLIRLVHTEWLKTAAGKREHVQRKVAGRCCSFCLIPEAQSSLELIPVDPAKRGKLEILDGVVQLQTRTVHTHAKCAPHWLRWLAIAEQYASQAEAEAADIEAGRTQQPVPAVPQLEQPKAGDASKHFNNAEQGL